MLNPQNIRSTIPYRFCQVALHIGVPTFAAPGQAWGGYHESDSGVLKPRIDMGGVGAIAAVLLESP